jgi:hypothetical protein
LEANLRSRRCISITRDHIKGLDYYMVDVATVHRIGKRDGDVVETANVDAATSRRQAQRLAAKTARKMRLPLCKFRP